ncbi:MAG: nucleotidyltransferase substrate binding protein [Candidatus Eremiobacteraeota bacterium]|nr:nucleotidyltransferase substrate binding protein [Candidatus Eremiobacteraeota bacterium]
MTKSEVLLSLKKLDSAKDRLKESLKNAQSQLEWDGVIKRFEFTYDQLWKTLKIALSYYGVFCVNPRTCIKEAFKNNLIPEDEVLLDMLEDRNETAHIYDEKTAEEVVERIKEVYEQVIENVIVKLKEAFEKS